MDCEAQQYHAAQESFAHYVKGRLWQHIIKRHLWRTLLWTFGALLIVELGLHNWNLEALTSQCSLVLLFVGALLGLIPESGPHLIFVTFDARKNISHGKY